LTGIPLGAKVATHGATMVALILRFVALGMLAAWLVLVKQDAQPVARFLVVVVCSAVALAIVSERRTWLRRSGLGVVILMFAIACLLDEDVVLQTGLPLNRLALLLLFEAAVAVTFLETRLWRWSGIPGIILVPWLIVHLVQFGYARMPIEHTAWLIQAGLLLLLNAGCRAFREDVERSRTLSSS
jgi:hypothetical protein